MIIKAKVVPNSREEKIEKTSDSEYVIRVSEPREKGKANTRVIELLAKEFHVSKKNIKIKNPISRRKIIEIKESVANIL